MLSADIRQSEVSTGALELQLRQQRRTVDFDTFDIHMQQLISMLKSGQIKVSPAYQRKFRWSPQRCSQFIESIMLGIPIPSLFMATNADSTWEVVDGVQRLSTIVKFAGDDDLRKQLGLNGKLLLSELQKLTRFNGLCLDELPKNLQFHWWTRPAKVITLNDKSDAVVRYDLFERLNTGGVALSPQEIRDCVFRGEFAEKLDAWSNDANFKTAVRLTPLQQRDATGEECVLRFFAFLNRYQTFEHNVTEFLNAYMESASRNFDYVIGESIFARTFKELARVFPNGIRRPDRKSTTPLNLYEGVAVGAALALEDTNRLRAAGLDKWMGSEELRGFTTGATNSRSAVIGRIEFCRDRFLGTPYVSRSST
ncbi:MAG TPA: DUF262 domain-containing protein [Bryobacteraceae bacterium]|nr:DUF262 domain-containing protein [Bryobacteraceae bacterium]